MNVDSNLLDAIFGKDSVGNTPEERAKTSKQLFVRSQDHLAFDNPRATGLRMSAEEALKNYGLEVLEDAMEKGSGILITYPWEPAYSIKSRRESLGLTPNDVASKAGVTLEVVIDSENSQTRTDIHALKKISDVLGLDVLKLGFVPWEQMQSSL